MAYKKTIKVLEDIWDKKGGQTYKCPDCSGSLTIVQVEPIFDAENAYTPYKTIIECSSCKFSLEAESFTILGCIKDFDLEYAEISSWSPSGSRVISKYKHMLDYDMLKKLKNTTELVEFLIVNEQIVQIIG